VEGITIRPLVRATDRRGIEAIDTSFTTPAVFDVVTSARGIELVERRVEPARVKRYAIGEVYAPWASWDTGWVAVDAPGAAAGAAIVGVATCGFEAWHQRLVLWHLYIAPAHRRRGVGRALLAEVEAHGRAAGATHVWIETSSVNVPGVAAYERLGYGLCGADTLFYGSYMPDEAALYLAKKL
jgi:ribosomal protein S18 acetylase RimI-like enzyme